MTIFEKLDGKKVLIFGFGKEGKSSFAFLKAHCPNTVIGIADSGFVDEAEVPGISLHLGSHAEEAIAEYDLVLKSPGVTFKTAVDESKLTSQTQLFLECYREQIIGVTGTKGKSTTSSLISHFLKQKTDKVFLAGNIGLPVFDLVDSMTEEHLVVFEMSCHQLEYATVSPKYAVYLNLYPEHLDHYGTFEKYKKAKDNIYLHQEETDYLYADATCEVQSAKAKRIEPLPLEFDINQTSLRGNHNYNNIAVAAGVASLFGVTEDEILKAVFTFRALPHRLEPVGEADGIIWYNDSISTIPQTAIEGLKSLPQTHTLILGGMDRGISYVPLVQYLHSHPVPLVILMPDTGNKIGMGLSIAGFGGEVKKAADLKEAVLLAKRFTPKGKTVLFSPAAASYGFFKDFMDRGEHFKQYVKERD